MRNLVDEDIEGGEYCGENDIVELITGKFHLNSSDDESIGSLILVRISQWKLDLSEDYG